MFDDPLAASRQDLHGEEERWKTIGMIGGIAVIVAHTWPGTDYSETDREAGRIVSARKATAPERSSMKKATSKALTRARKADLETLDALPDDGIDTSDIPEVLNWPDAERGLFYRPVKQQITLRLDADVVAWFKRRAPGGRGYQTAINRALRQHVQRSGNA